MEHTNERAVPAGTGNGSQIAQLGSIRSLENTPNADGAQRVDAVYFGQSLIGWIAVRCDGRFNAVSANGNRLGRYNHPRGAICALISHSGCGGAS